MLVYLCHFADMDDTVFVSSLNAIQKARMVSIAKLSRARQYLYSRVVYNALFSQYTGKPFMEDLPKAQSHPSIEGKNGARFFTSLSHSGNHVALALSDKGKVAIDIEQILDRDYKTLAPFAFSKEDCDRLAQTGYDREHFYRLWGFKECIHKLQTKHSLCYQEIISPCQGPDLMLSVLASEQELISTHQLNNPLNLEKFHD